MDANALYGLPLERFTAERNALVKALRTEGRRDEATRVAAMRKPSVAAWAVNQLVRTQRRELKALLQAGDALQRAQSELVAGRADSAALRKASERERTAVDQLVQTARGLLSSEGSELSPATLERVAETLRAAALDQGARAQVKEGCLVAELRHVGLGSSGALGGGERDSARVRQRTPSKGARRADAAERKRAEGLKAAKKAEAAARRDLERSSREAQSAERRRDQAAEALEEAEAAVSIARRRAEEATREHDRARRELDRA